MKRHFILYLLLALASVSLGQTGEIIHTICGPEYGFTVNYDHPEEGLIYLDYNQDGEADHYIFSEHVYSGMDCQIRIQGVDGTGWRINPYPSNMGDTIATYADSLFVWPWYARLRGWRYNYSPNVSNEYQDTYYSVRKPMGDKMLYAWFRMSIVWKGSKDVTVEIHEMAYCSEPGYPLCVGQTSYDWTDLQESQPVERITVRPNPTTGTVRVDGMEAAEIQVYNTLGQLVRTFRHTNEASLEGLPQGVYQLRVTDRDGNAYTEKVVKE